MILPWGSSLLGHTEDHPVVLQQSQHAWLLRTLTSGPDLVWLFLGVLFRLLPSLRHLSGIWGSGAGETAQKCVPLTVALLLGPGVSRRPLTAACNSSYRRLGALVWPPQVTPHVVYPQTHIKGFVISSEEFTWCLGQGF